MSDPTPDTSKAVSILRAGGLVAFPTETVYGLGADATNPSAIEKIFAAKGRPSTNPLIVHVADTATAQRYTTAWPPAASRLSSAFWPGPLTLVLPKAPSIAPRVTATLSTVGLRVPNHPLALKLLRAFDGPLAAPSANRSTRISPTTAAHVRAELKDEVDLILDGGPCTVGIESTVLDLTVNPPAILRPGAISREQIQSIIGPVSLAPVTKDSSTPAPSPGQHEIHYAPRTPAFRFDPSQRRAIPIGRVAVVTLDPRIESEVVIHMPATPHEYARRLYSVLRDLDGLNLPAIYIELPPDKPEWLAVRDRLRRATRPLTS
jgi:L-threonylcarbamoyladenylate synthase